MGLTDVVTYSSVVFIAIVLQFLKKATFRGYSIKQPAKKVNTEPAGMAPVFRCKEESRRVKTLRSSCFIQGAGLYCLSCTGAEWWGAEGVITVLQFLLPASNVTGLGHRGSKTGKEVTAYIIFFLSKAKADTQLFMSLWGAFWDFEFEPSYCSLFRGDYWLVNNCHSANNLGVEVRRKPCMRELPLSTFPKEWWNCLHGVNKFVSAYHHAMEYEDVGVAHIGNCALLLLP